MKSERRKKLNDNPLYWCVFGVRNKIIFGKIIVRTFHDIGQEILKNLRWFCVGRKRRTREQNKNDKKLFERTLIRFYEFAHIYTQYAHTQTATEKTDRQM